MIQKDVKRLAFFCLHLYCIPVLYVICSRLTIIDDIKSLSMTSNASKYKHQPTACLLARFFTVADTFSQPRMHQNAGFCMRNIKIFRGSRSPDLRGGRGNPPRCPPAQCWCPSASFSYGTEPTDQGPVFTDRHMPYGPLL